MNNLNGPFAKRSVCFGFDRYAVQPALIQHAHYLKNHPQRHVFIQGNTDERGSSEYNLALGQKRSEVVLQNLALLGMPPSRMEAVSVGKEKLVATGLDEEL